MSKLFKLFGKKNTSQNGNNKQSQQETRSADINAAIAKLDEHISRLEKQKNHTNTRIAKLTQEAQIAARKKDKKTALYKLKLRKQLESRKERMDGAMMNLELQKLALDDVLSQANMIDTMSQAQQALKTYVNEDEIEKAEQLKDDLQDQMDTLDDLNAIMNEPLTFGPAIDEDELEMELKLLEEEDMINDPNSDLFLYNQSINNNDTIEQKEVNNDIDNNNNKNTHVKLSKEEEKELLELEQNVLLNKGNDNDEDKEIIEMSSESGEDNTNSYKEIKMSEKEVEKKRLDVMMVTKANTCVLCR